MGLLVNLEKIVTIVLIDVRDIQLNALVEVRVVQLVLRMHIVVGV